MLLIVLALFWLALLAPIVVRKFRDGGTEKSIQSFHAEHEVLSRQDYAVAPAHRLDRPDDAITSSQSGERRPRLTVVHADDTFGTLETRASWDEWSDDYEYDDEAAERGVTNHYARAYASRPEQPAAAARYEAPIRRRTMRAQRRMIFTRLALAALALTAIAVVTRYSFFIDVAALAWISLILFVALALYAVSQGFLEEESLPVRLPRRRPLATIEPLYRESEDFYTPRYEGEFTSEFYEPDDESTWRREPQRRAFG